MRRPDSRTVWFFDLDNTLHDAGRTVFPRMNAAMTDYICEHLELPRAQADELRVRYWLRYGSTLLGLMRHHRVSAAHFLHETHRFADLEREVTGHRHDLAALKRLPGRKVRPQHAPGDYALRVLRALRIENCFDALIPIEDMHMFGHLRPKPDGRLFRHLPVRLGVSPHRCVLVEDSLENQKAARSAGWATVWMQRWTKASVGDRPHVGRSLRRRLPFVDVRVRRLQALCKNHPVG